MIVRSLLFFNIFALYSLTSYGQTDSLSGIPLLKFLINEGEIESARQALNEQLESLFEVNNTDSLVKYVFLAGSKKLANDNWDLAIANAESFAKKMYAYDDPYVDKEVLLEVAWIMDDAGYRQKAFDLTEKALEPAQRITGDKPSSLAVIYYNMADRIRVLGDHVKAKEYYLKSIAIDEQKPERDHEALHITYNALGINSWYRGYLDSTKYFFDKALVMLDSLEKSPRNKYYRPSLLKMNMSVVENNLGNLDAAIKMTREAVRDFQIYIDSSDMETDILRSQTHRLAAIENLGSYYSAYGDFEKSDQMVQYALRQKRKYMAEDDFNITTSLVLCAQNNIGLKNIAEANAYVDTALARMQIAENTDEYWKAAALITKGEVSQELGNVEEARQAFLEADRLYTKSIGEGNISVEYSQMLSKASKFFAQHDDEDLALRFAKKLYNVTQDGDFKDNLIGYRNTLNLAQVYFYLEDFQNANKYSTEALNFYKRNGRQERALIDSVTIEFQKPRGILLESQSEYASTNDRNKTFLKKLEKRIDEAISILENRKKLTHNYEQQGGLIEDNFDVFDFAKQLQLDLYNLDQDPDHLQRLLSLHESGIYNRIRTRLNSRKSTIYAGVPEMVIEREKVLKDNISTFLDEENDINRFFEIEQDWESYVDSLKRDYPKYYALKYSALEEPLEHILANLSESVTILRYVYVNDELNVIVVNGKNLEHFSLDVNDQEKSIQDMIYDYVEGRFNSQLLHKIYKVIWEPIRNAIKTDKVIIIPDRQLFNISFETLVSSGNSEDDQGYDHSLLNDYSISYNYSLLLLSSEEKMFDYKNDFVAFAPAFTDDMKADYMVALKDSMEIDRTYLDLLPQPFSVDIVKKYSRIFRGKSFVNAEASKDVFAENAREHKIIHIGTHAESNNVSPELSRLIFAKSLEDEDNSLYAYEIYNQNLNSDLSILTACETGKPTYQSGEGMISLAHAFNYAGSKSILTSLWKIDEKSTATIINYFYENLAKGLEKDEALRQAKLTYINNAEGREKQFEYWGGLVLIGDTTALELGTTLKTWHLILLGIFVLSVGRWLLGTRKRKSAF